jgi:hypothetical protein
MGKGREITAAVVLFLLPSLCMAQGWIALMGDKTEFAAGESFTLELGLHSDVGLGFGQFQLLVMGSNGPANHWWFGQFVSEGDWFGTGGFTPGSLSGPGNTKLGDPARLDTADPELIFHTGAFTDAPKSGSLARYVLTADAAIPWDDYVFTLVPEQTLFTTATGAADLSIGTWSSYVPEPVSAMLLLTGLPLVMRRWRI